MTSTGLYICKPLTSIQLSTNKLSHRSHLGCWLRMKLSVRTWWTFSRITKSIFRLSISDCWSQYLNRNEVVPNKLGDGLCHHVIPTLDSLPYPPVVSHTIWIEDNDMRRTALKDISKHIVTSLWIWKLTCTHTVHLLIRCCGRGVVPD